MNLLSQAEVVTQLDGFEQGVVGVIIAGFFALGGIMLRRWHKAMDNLEKRDENHQKIIEELTKNHHEKILEIHKVGIEKNLRTISILESISQGIEGVRSKINQCSNENR